MCGKSIFIGKWYIEGNCCFFQLAVLLRCAQEAIMDDNCATSYERRKSIFLRFSVYWMLKIPTLPWLKFNSTFLIDETSSARGHKVEEQTEKLSKLFSSGNNNSRLYDWTLLRGYNLIWAKNKKQGGWSREKFLIKWKLIIFKEFENWSGLATRASQPSFSWRIKNRTSYCGFVLKKNTQSSIDSPRLLFNSGKTSRCEVGTWKSVRIRSLFEVETTSISSMKTAEVSLNYTTRSKLSLNYLSALLEGNYESSLSGLKLNTF